MALASAPDLYAPLSKETDEELAGLPPVISPVRRLERVSSIDVLRGFALLGILMVNIDNFSGPESLHDIPVGVGVPAFTGPHTHLNLIVLLLKFAFIENKMRGLFSVLFGAGVILFTSRAKRRGGAEKSGDTFLRRNMWLVVFGVLHGTLLWRGDILMMYGLNALLVLYVCRNLKPKTLLIAGTIVWTVISTFAFFNHFKVFETLGLARRESVIVAHQQAGRPLTAEEKKTQQEWEAAVGPTKVDSGEVQKEIAMRTRGYLPYVQNEGSKFWKSTFTIIGVGASIDSLGAMLVGMALFKIGFLSAELPSATYLWTALIGFLISIPLSVVSVLKSYATGFSELALDKWLYSSENISAEAGTIATAAALVLLYKSGVFRGLLRPFAAVGQMALTNYLLTSLLCQWIFRFGPWKLYGRLEYYQGTYVVFAVWAVNLIVSPLWLRSFEFGPFEWLWRSLTYWKLQPMRFHKESNRVG
jgi:uncharacterized protein